MNLSAQELKLFGLIILVVLLGVVPIVVFLMKKKSAIAPPTEKPLSVTEPKVTSQKAPEARPTKSWQERLKEGLGRGRRDVWSKIESLLSKDQLDENIISEMEEVLYSADLGSKMVNSLLKKVQEEKVNIKNNPSAAKKVLFDFLNEKMLPIQSKLQPQDLEFRPTGSTKVIMIVGINGVGKTTTVGKLAHNFVQQGAKVVVGAADTFRAAAVDQLQIWCQRAGAEFIRGVEGSDPSGVAYEALRRAKEVAADICIIDTAGRLHTNKNLMQELSKVKRVLAKLDQDAPHETLLVLDAITGTNGLVQAKEFHQELKLTGVIFTKCDGSSKAGSAVSIIEELGVPIVYIGVGEGVEDLQRFSPTEYLEALLGSDAASLV